MKHTMALRRVNQEFAETPFWLITFADLLLLLITAFVIRLSVGNWDDLRLDPALALREQERLERLEFSKQLAGALHTNLDEELFKSEPAPKIPLAPLEVDDLIAIRPLANGVELRLAGGNFLPASREISATLKRLLGPLAKMILRLPVEVRIAGHTDNTPINTLEFPSNWELSAARAISVAEELMLNSVPGSDISAVGYADSRPVGNNSSAEGRALNRRVELVLRLTAIPKQRAEDILNSEN